MIDMDAAARNEDSCFRYLIVSPAKGGLRDLFRFMVRPSKETAFKFIESSDDKAFEEVLLADNNGGGGGVTPEPDYRWVILVSIVVRKIIMVCRKPMEWVGCVTEFFLNLLSLNGNFLGLLYNFFRGKVVMPRRGSDTFISAIGHLDGRIDLDGSDHFLEGERGGSASGVGPLQMDISSSSLLDLSMLASKLAYENANVVRNVVNLHWKMHFVNFYNCWNDYQKERSTQVFIFCDKPKDANLIFISFRGTEPFDADDWATDFDYSWYEIPELGKVHMGFLEALGLGSRTNTSTFRAHLHVNNRDFPTSYSFDSTASPSGGSKTLPSLADADADAKQGNSDSPRKRLMPEMVEMTAYYAVRSKLKSLLKEHKNAKFMVTGHSLGGALAILFPTVLVLHKEEEVIQRLLGVHTFGQPRVGNEQICRFMESHLEHPVCKYFRVVYCNDLVSRLPYDDATFLYKHFGVCLYYNSGFFKQKVDEEPNRNYFGWRFLLPKYINAVWELLRSLIMGYLHGPDYKETWESVFLRVFGLAVPGISAHSPTNYINSIRLGREEYLDVNLLGKASLAKANNDGCFGMRIEATTVQALPLHNKGRVWSEEALLSQC